MQADGQLAPGRVPILHVGAELGQQVIAMGEYQEVVEVVQAGGRASKGISPSMS
jgi:hypothetical protein